MTAFFYLAILKPGINMLSSLFRVQPALHRSLSLVDFLFL